jgi:hypothetical protein
LLLLTLLPGLALGAPLEFHLSFPEKVRKEAFTGRAYVMLTRNDVRGLMRSVNWVRPEPFFAADFKGVKPGEVMVIGGKALAHPTPLAKLPKGTWTVQAVIDLAPGSLSFSAAPGNLYAIQRLELDPEATGPVRLSLDRVVEDRPFKESERIKLVRVQSKHLTAFHGKPVWMQAAVLLPESYAEKKEEAFPVYYEVPGFSGDHHAASRYLAAGSTSRGGRGFLHVLLDPSCHHGHHVFADSANNGPWGKALVEELIPVIDERFRTMGAKGRLVGGHSSGGWSSLWLQISYPEVFNGCWSTAPDSVAFHDFQQVDIYAPRANFFFEDGKPRPLIRSGGKVLLTIKPFSDMERVMGHGGQLASFEAVFSVRGKDGQPKKLWDRDTGAIDPEVAKSWEKYDIRLKLRREWKELGPKLGGKIHVYMGDEDTFYLDGATRLLKAELKKLGSDAVVEMFPGKDHSSLMTAALRKRIGEEMAARVKAAK